MIHRQKSHVDLLECTATSATPGNPYASAEQAASSYVHVRAQSDAKARKAFVDSLKQQIEADDYCIDSIALAHCLQWSPLTNALLHLNTDEHEDTPT